MVVVAHGIGRCGRAIEGLVNHLQRGLVFFRGGLQFEAPAVFYLVVPEQFEVLVIHHVLHLRPFERHEHVVLVGRHEAVGGGHDVAVVGKGEVVHRVLARQVGFFVERVGHLAEAFPFVVLEAVGYVTAQEEVGIEVGGGLRGGAKAQAVHGVVRNHRVHRPDVHFGGFLRVNARFHEVFYKCFCHEEYGLEALHALQLLQECPHALLAEGERVGAVFLPKGLRAHLGVGVEARVALEAECLVGNFLKREVAIFRGAAHVELAEKVGHLELHNHVVLDEHLLARGQRRKVLNDAHTLHEVHVGAVRNAEVGAQEAVGAVGDDVEAAREAEVLRIVGREIHLNAARGVYVQRIDDEISVEGNARLGGNRADEAVLQQAHLIFIYIHVGEAVFEHRVEDFTRVDQFVDAFRALADYDVLFRARFAAEYLPRDAFVDRHRQNELACLVARFHVVFQEGETLELAFLENLFRHLVEGERRFGIFVDAEIVVVVEVVALLAGNHLLHQFHGGVVLARILRFLGFHHRRAEHVFQGREFHLDASRLLHRHRFRFVANHRNPYPSCHERYGEASLVVGLHAFAVGGAHVGKGQRLPRLRIGHHARKPLRERGG